MKKLFSTIIAVTMLLSLTACVSQGADTSEDVLRVGIDLKFPPFSYIDENGDPAGLEPEIAEAFGEYLGKEVEIVNTDFSLLIPALETGDVDILIADMSRTDERAEKADFSDPYRYTQSLVLVNKEYAEVNNVSNLAPDEFFALPDQKFIGLAGTMGVLVPQSFGVPVTEITEIGSGILEVTNGFSTALVASNEVHAFQAANSDTTVVYYVGNVSASSFVTRKGDEEMIEKSNEFIASMYEEGGFYDEIREEYDVIIGEFLGNDELGLDYIINYPN